MNRTTESFGDKCRVLIVGGGLAGLSAAEALARDHGDRFLVTLLEAKRTAGGRAGSFIDPSSGETIDYCQHVAMGCCTNLLGLLQRCSLGDSMHRYRELEFHHPDHPPSRFAPSRFLPPPLHLAGAIAKLRYLSAAQKQKIRRTLWRLMRTPADLLASQTARDWLVEQGQDDQTMCLFWDVVLVSALGEQTGAVSMAAARKVFMDGFAAARGASDVLVPKQPLSKLFGESLCKEIGKLGVQLQTGHAVTNLCRNQDETIVVETKQGQRFEADHLISAVPWHAVADMAAGLDGVSLDDFQTIAASPITGMHLWFDCEITDRPHAVMVGTVAQWLFRQPYWQPSDAGHYYQVVISASSEHRDKSKEQLVSLIIDELRHEFPLAKRARLLRSRVVTDPQSVFSLTPAVAELRPSARTALPWFHLAGDWIATGWPATMEGAVISGRMAAASVLKSEGRSGIPIDPGLSRGLLARLIVR